MLALLDPPVVSASDAALSATLVVLVVAALGLLAWSAADGRRRRSWIPLLAFGGGVLALPIEPFWDVNVQFSFAANSHPVAFTAFGREIPVYLAFIYPAFIGWGSYLGYLLILRGATRRQLLMLPAAFFVADLLIEVAGAAADLWDYYGHQAWNPLDWPMYFGVLNGSITLLGGALLVMAERRLRGAGRMATLLVVPTAYVGVYAVAGWPTWAALNADVPGVVVWFAGALTMSIAAGTCWLVADEVGVDCPAAEPRPAPITAPAEPADLTVSRA